MSGEVTSSQNIDSSARGPPTEKEHLQQQMLEEETDLEGEEESEEVEYLEAIQAEDSSPRNPEKSSSQTTEKQQ